MKRLTAYGITPNALKTLLATDTEPSKLPDGWFNWVGNKGSSHSVQRLQLLHVVDADLPFVRWSENAIAAGYECFLLTSTDDVLGHAALHEMNDEVAHYIIAPILSLQDPHEYKNLLEMLREPECELQDDWADLRGGGGSTLEGWEVKPSQWWAYAEALSDWITRTAGNSVAALALRQTGLDFSTWRWTAQLDPTLLDLDCWPNRANPWTKKEIPELERYGYIAFYPLRQMPCSGIATDNQGGLHTIGALSTENGQWLWDDGSIRAAFEVLARPKPIPLRTMLKTMISSAQDFFGDVVDVMQGVVQGGVLHAADGGRPPYHFDLGHGEYISVEINDSTGRVTVTPNLGDPQPYSLFWVDDSGVGFAAANKAAAPWAQITTLGVEFGFPENIPLKTLKPVIVIRPVPN